MSGFDRLLVTTTTDPPGRSTRCHSANAVRWPLEVLDDEVRVDEVEGPVGEGQRAAQVGDGELVERLVHPPARFVEVDADQPVDPVAKAGQAGRPAAAGLEHARARAESLPEQTGLNLGVRRVKRQLAPSGGWSTAPF